MRLPPLATLPARPFTRDQIRELGVSSAVLDELLESGQVVRVLRGVFRRAIDPDTLEMRVASVALVSRRFWVITDRTAAWLHGIDVLDYRELEILPLVDFVALRGHARVRNRGCSGGERDLTPADVVCRDGVLITTTLRTVMDLGCRLPRREALAALDAFMRICGITRDELYAALPGFAGRRGVKQLRQLIPLADHRSESTGESWTRLAVVDAGLPPPTPQLWVYDGDRRKYRVDLGYEKCRVAIEYDGVDFHDAREQREHDEERRAWLRRRGWTVIVVRRDSFAAAALESWLRELRVALGLAA